jgi:hypothetical protein
MDALLAGRAPAAPTAPRVPAVRAVNGRLARAGAYLLMGFGAAMGSGPPPDAARVMPMVALARAVCRDPDPGAAGPALGRIDGLLAAAEGLAAQGSDRALAAIGLVMAAGVIAATDQSR